MVDSIITVIKALLVLACSWSFRYIYSVYFPYANRAGHAHGPYDSQRQARHQVSTLSPDFTSGTVLDCDLRRMRTRVSARRHRRHVDRPVRDDTGRQHYEALGAADDARDPDGLSVFSFAQAQAKSRAFFARKARELAGDATSTEGPYKVTDALDDYFKNYAKRGKAVSAALSAANLHIRPTLGTLPIARLTMKRLRDWHHAIADKPRQARGKRGGSPKDAKRSTPGVTLSASAEPLQIAC